ncbi:hypothetical protein P879_11997, partial [Paragonimus westermani]
VAESVHSRAEAPHTDLNVESTPPLSPLRETSPRLSSTENGEERGDQTPTGNTTTDRSTAIIYTPQGFSYSKQSSSGVDWLSTVVLPGSSNTTSIADDSPGMRPTSPPVNAPLAFMDASPLRISICTPAPGPTTTLLQPLTARSPTIQPCFPINLSSVIHPVYLV